MGLAFLLNSKSFSIKQKLLYKLSAAYTKKRRISNKHIGGTYALLLATVISTLNINVIKVYAEEATGSSEERATDTSQDTVRNSNNEVGEDAIDNSTKKTYTIYHRHTGGSGGGGCYTVRQSGSRTIEVPCGGKLHYFGDAWGTSQCGNCGAAYFGDRGGEWCPHSSTRTEYYSYYTMGCNKGTDTPVGYVTYTISTTDWTTGNTVSIDIENIDMTLPDAPYVMDGEASDNNVFYINENGVYKFGIAPDPNSNGDEAVFIAEIKNIDKASPNITDYSLIPDEWVRDGVTLNIEQARDLQEDGTLGCGLHELPYSYDNGSTWESEPQHFYDENGEYAVLVRDKLGNTGSLSISIDNIDREPPNIVSMDYDSARNLKSAVLRVECNDILPDGRMGAGLHEQPYSYDGGRTWRAENSYVITNNCKVDFVVRDAIGNIRESAIEIKNIDNHMPTVSHTLYPDYWTKGSVTVVFTAKDINPDGGNGVGLGTDCFSYDGGKSWGSENEITVDNNGNVAVAVRDKNENINFYSLDVNNIDRQAPELNVAFSLSDDGSLAYLEAIAKDDVSGINENSFAWSNSMTEAKISVTENGIYTVSVSDRAGNIATSDIYVSGIKEAGIIQLINLISKDEDKEEAREAEEAEEVKVLLQQNSANSNESIFTEADSEKNKSLWDRLKEKIGKWWSGLSDLEKIVLLGTILVILSLGILWLFVLIRSARIFSCKGGKSYIYLGREYIDFKDGTYKITLSERKWEKSQTTHFKLKFNYIFVTLHKQTSIYIYFPNGKYACHKIKRVIEIEV